MPGVCTCILVTGGVSLSLCINYRQCCFQPSDISFPHQVPEPLFFFSFGFSIILEVATPPQQEVSRCFRFSTLDACPSGFSEVPSRIQPLPATPSTGLPPSLLPSWASQITSQVVNSLHQSSYQDCLGEKLCVSQGATSWLETGLETVSSNRRESGHHIKKKNSLVAAALGLWLRQSRSQMSCASRDPCFCVVYSPTDSGLGCRTCCHQ